jgi:hypothetical protein
MALPGDPTMAAPAAPQPAMAGVAPVQPMQPQAPTVRPEPSPEDVKLAEDYLKRIQAAKDRPQTKDALKTFARNRKLLRGVDPDNGNKKLRTNLFFANLAMMRPQVYAKDPEYSVKVSSSVPEEKLPMMKQFATTCETVLTAELVKGCKLKKRAKRLLTSTFATSVGWWKLIFQEDKRTDPLAMNQIKDTQDELMRLQALRQSMDDPLSCRDADLKLAELQQTLAGLQSNSEITVARGLVLDFVLAEDISILDPSVRELGDYERSSAMAHRVWFTRSAYRARFGYEPKGTRTFTEQTGPGAGSNGEARSNTGNATSDDDLFEVHEVWDQDKSRVFHVCVGEKGFCCEPTSPDWTGERWIPFFLLMFNETDGDMFPLSDVELTEPLVREYNEARDDLVQDRRDTRPFTVLRKGGSLTPKDAENIRNRRGNDIIEIEGNGGNTPLTNDIAAITLGKIDPQNYNTQPARSDIEQIIGGGDAARGTVMEAKTATEAEILNQGLRGRSAERQDIMEDLLTEVGTTSLQILLRKLTPDEVKQIAGDDAQWPSTLSIEQIFRMVTLDVRGGSTGKPDRLQDQDRWTKLLPVIEKTVEQVSQLRQQGQNELAGALVELTRETLRRFDERLDIEQFLPKSSDAQQVDPQALAQENQQLKQKVQEQGDELSKMDLEREKAEMSTAATLATSPTPAIAIQAFGLAMQIIEGVEQSDDGTGQPPGAVQAGLMAKLQSMLAQQPQPGTPSGAAPGGPPAGLPPQIPQAPAQTGPDQPQPQ